MRGEVQIICFFLLISSTLSETTKDGHCFTKLKNGRFVSVGDCENKDAEAVIEQLKQNVAKAEEKEALKNWFRASNGLYYKAFGDEVNYKKANSSCHELGARLASTGIRNSTIRSELLKSVVNDTVWIGLHDLNQEGIYMWSDGVVSKNDSTPWRENQPNNWENQDCVRMQKNHGRKLNDRWCAKDRSSYLCEKEVQ